MYYAKLTNAEIWLSFDLGIHAKSFVNIFIAPSIVPVCLISRAGSAVAGLVTFYQSRYHLVPTSSYHQWAIGITLENHVKEIMGAKE